MKLFANSLSFFLFPFCLFCVFFPQIIHFFSDSIKVYPWVIANFGEIKKNKNKNCLWIKIMAHENALNSKQKKIIPLKSIAVTFHYVEREWVRVGGGEIENDANIISTFHQLFVFGSFHLNHMLIFCPRQFVFFSHFQFAKWIKWNHALDERNSSQFIFALNQMFIKLMWQKLTELPPEIKCKFQKYTNQRIENKFSEKQRIISKYYLMANHRSVSTRYTVLAVRRERRYM